LKQTSYCNYFIELVVITTVVLGSTVTTVSKILFGKEIAEKKESEINKSKMELLELVMFQLKYLPHQTIK